MEKIKKFFKVEQRGSTLTKEILAGVTIFLAMKRMGDPWPFG